MPPFLEPNAAEKGVATIKKLIFSTFAICLIALGAVWVILNPAPMVQSKKEPPVKKTLAYQEALAARDEVVDEKKSVEDILADEQVAQPQPAPQDGAQQDLAALPDGTPAEPLPWQQPGNPQPGAQPQAGYPPQRYPPADPYGQATPPAGNPYGQNAPATQNPYNRNAPGQNPYGANAPGAQDTYGQNPPGGAYAPPGAPPGDPYAAQDPYGQDPYAQDPYAQDPYADRDPYSQDPYGQDPNGQDPYGQNAAVDPYAGQNAYPGQPPGQGQPSYPGQPPYPGQAQPPYPGQQGQPPGQAQNPYPGQGQPQEEWVRVIGSGTGMRNSASEDSPVLFAFPYGRNLKVVSRNGAWVEVKDPNSSAKGWMEAHALAPTANPNAYAQQPYFEEPKEERRGPFRNFLDRAFGN